MSEKTFYSIGWNGQCQVGKLAHKTCWSINIGIWLIHWEHGWECASSQAQAFTATQSENIVT